MQPELPLRDIHLPEAIGWWPPAPGWWIVAVLIISALFALAWWIRRILRPTAVKSANKLLQQIAEDSSMNDFDKLQQISALLRRVAISLAPREQTAHLHGRKWLQYLDQSLADQPFSTGPGQCLANMHFRPQNEVNIEMDELLALCNRWLKEQKA